MTRADARSPRPRPNTSPRIRSTLGRVPTRRAEEARVPQRRIRFNPFLIGLLGALGACVGLGVWGALGSLSTVFVYIGIAYFIALALEPLMKLAERHNIPRWAASLGVAVLALAVIAGVALAIVPNLVRQANYLITHASELTDRLLAQPWVIWISDQLGTSLDLDSIIKDITSFLSDPDKLLSIGGGLLSVGSGVFEGITAVIVVTVLTIYLTLTLRGVMATVYQAVPQSRRAGFMEITEEILESVGKYVAGQFVLALANATITLILVLIVGGPAPLLLALVAFVCALIPVVGPILGTTIGAVSILTINPLGALIFAIIMLVYLQVEAYILTPRVMAKAVAVPGVLVIVAAIGGAALGGILGALVAVPVVAAGILIFQRVIRPIQDAR
ncbi:AI-2E family transporter [Agreia sp. PsM10]|uniref:AI-2E family transporter n=1 Tax=Agreia sp. PsM10 TaxID=3030533 RepID=UPI00263B621F|nr:AI-2E family transporter [Agreia sp. PsM10]MDN4642032.1 AI-2E family transporter [Agreia sp. PsM10]